MIENRTFFFIKINNLINLFIISFFLLRLPPLIIPFINISFFNSHTLARFFLIYLSLIIFFKKKKINGDKTFLLILILFLLGVKSISILKAVSIEGFWNIFKDFIFGILFFYLGFNLIEKKTLKKIILFFLITIFINTLIQTIIFFRTDFFINILSTFLYPKYIDNFFIHYHRGRFFVDIFDAALLPFLIYLFTKTRKKLLKFLLLVNIFLISFFSFISGFRIQLLTIVLGLIFTFIIFEKTRKFIISLSILTFLLIGFIKLQKNINLNLFTLERLNLNEQTNIQPIISRFDFWEKAVGMGLSHLFLGVGLGNFYDYYYPKNIFLLSIFNPRNKLFEVTAFHPHNIFFATFAETGVLSLILLISILVFFLKDDIRDLNAKKNNRIFIICFWLLFFYSLVGPDNIIQYIVLFWFLRLMIIFIKDKKFISKKFLSLVL
jgi:O-antigen ligase